MKHAHARPSVLQSAASQRGISLIDVSIVIAIVGILMAGFLATYKVYQSTRATSVTEENFIAVQEAIGTFVAINNRYPKPMRYGVFDGIESNDKQASCSSTTAKNKVCTATVSGEVILMGAVPFADLNLPPEQIRDGFGRLFTYAVGEKLTLANGNDPLLTGGGLPDLDANGNPKFHRYVCGRIRAINNDGTVTQIGCTAGENNPPSDIALVSHGKDGIGAWLPSGAQYMPCTSAGHSQERNCNFGGTFERSMRRTVDGGGNVSFTLAIVQADDVGRNDDSLQMEIREDSNFWAQDASDKIANRYNYSVGIGVLNPQAPLDVDGNIRANAVLAERLCLSDGGGGPGMDTNCLKTATIAGDDAKMQCNEIGVVRDINSNAVSCEYLTAVSAPCPAGKYANGFDGDGKPVCVDLPVSCGSAHNSQATTPPTADLCYNGTAGAVSGSGPWTWRCTSGSSGVNCRTAPVGGGGCDDECGNQRNHGDVWCVAGTGGTARCTNGAVVAEPTISGVGCNAVTTTCN